MFWLTPVWFSEASMLCRSTVFMDTVRRTLMSVRLKEGDVSGDSAPQGGARRSVRRADFYVADKESFSAIRSQRVGG